MIKIYSIRTPINQTRRKAADALVKSGVFSYDIGMPRGFVKDFYDVQKEQKKKSLFLFAVLFLFYVAAIGVLIFALDFGIGAVLAGPRTFSGVRIAGTLGLALAFAVAIAAFQYHDARKNGAPFILKRISAKRPDLTDLYHRQFMDVVQEMGIAAGIPAARPYVIPDHTINGLALLEPDGVAAIAVTEGMLADFTRDELGAAVAHECAHIVRGDTFFLTFVCSMADFFERLRDSFSPGKDGEKEESLLITTIFMRLLSRFISREREILADAAAVELCRNPVGLARAIYKAHIKNSFVGDFDATYAPLFIVSPESRGEGEDKVERWMDTHPPLMKRIRLLAEMADVRSSDVIRQVWETQTRREAAKSLEPVRPETSLAAGQRRPAEAAGVSGERGKCPHCRTPLADDFYEGVPIQYCRHCAGKLVDGDIVDRILARTEVGFSDDLRGKAEEFRERFLRNPIKTMKINDRSEAHPACPGCGYNMAPRPFNYQYFVPVKKCLSCGRIWFDADELEILQILVEEAKAR
jgi:Zn-dependent protease with chaperone function/Zn-finger nucleic acid-binding protein